MDEHQAVLELRKQWSQMEKDPKKIGDFLVSNGRMPGGRANISLAVDAGKKLAAKPDARRIVDKWLIKGDEYLSIVSILTLGNLMMLSPSERDAAAPILQRAILNKKWRVREAVPLALRPLAEKDPAYIIALFRNWTAEGYPVMYRAAIEVLADKSILRKHPSTLVYLKEVHIKAMGEIEFHPKETGEPMELLKKALSSAIAILAVHDPSTIQIMEEWAKVPVLRPIVRSNIGEPMFRKRFPDETATLLDYIDKGI